MRFKFPVIELEFTQAHPKVQAIALYADWWTQRFMGRDLFLTDVGRTQAEYDQIYSRKIAEGMFFVDDAGVKHYSGARPHLQDDLAGVPSHAVDFRTIGEMNDMEVARLRDHLNAVFTRTDKKPTALYHDVGAGAHLHVQAKV